MKPVCREIVWTLSNVRWQLPARTLSPLWSSSKRHPKARFALCHTYDRVTSRAAANAGQFPTHGKHCDGGADIALSHSLRSECFRVKPCFLHLKPLILNMASDPSFKREIWLDMPAPGHAHMGRNRDWESLIAFRRNSSSQTVGRLERLPENASSPSLYTFNHQSC